MRYWRISKLKDPQQSSRLTSPSHPAKLNDLSRVTKAGQQNGSDRLKKKKIVTVFLNKYNCVINLKMLTYLGSKILVDKISSL